MSFMRTSAASIVDHSRCFKLRHVLPFDVTQGNHIHFPLKGQSYFTLTCLNTTEQKTQQVDKSTSRDLSPASRWSWHRTSTWRFTMLQSHVACWLLYTCWDVHHPYQIAMFPLYVICLYYNTSLQLYRIHQNTHHHHIIHQCMSLW